MEREQSTLPLSSGQYGGDRGAGGKVQKPSLRRTPATPYARPTANQSLITAQRRDAGWLSKIVDPAYRLITDGATRILPSFFSKLPLPAAAADSAEDHDNGGTNAEENGYDDNQGRTWNLGITESTGGKIETKGADNLPGCSDFGHLGQGKTSNLPDVSEFSKIEQLVMGKSFSRAEIVRLTEILHSRVAEPEENKSDMDAKREGQVAVLAFENPRTSTAQKNEALHGAPAERSMPLLHSAVKEEVGASPADIAKAYMGSLSEAGTDSRRIMSRDGRDFLRMDRFASEHLIPSPSPKSSVCWPGAMVQDQHGCSTPQRANTKSGLHYFPRSPYSRTIFSKSRSKLTHSQADKNRYLNIHATPQQQPQTPLYGQSKDEIPNDGHRSVGPIRQSRRKFLSEVRPRVSSSYSYSENSPSMVRNSNTYKEFLPAIKKNLEAGATSTTTEFESAGNTLNSSELGIPTLQTSNPAVRAILEHLDRNKPTPKEKSAELQLVTSWKKSTSSEGTNTMPKERTSLQQAEGFSFHKNTSVIALGSSAQGNHTENSNSIVRSQERSTNEATDVVNKDIEAFNSANGRDDSQIRCTHETTLLGFSNIKQKGVDELRPLHNHIEGGQGTASMAAKFSGFELLKKPPSHPSGTKPVLASISVSKPDMRRAMFSDNSSGFTFPVSRSSGVLSEPPTPSIMPTTSSIGLPQPKDGPAIPSYSFGTKRSTPALIFSFPSTSTDPIQDDGAKLKFGFGSEKSRISFGSIGDDGVCY